MKTAIRNTFLVTAMAGVLGMTAVAMASPHDCSERADPEDRLEYHLDRMSRHLGLSDGQRAQIEVVLRDGEAEMTALRGQMREGRRALHQLNPEQVNFEDEIGRLFAEQGEALTSLIQLRAMTMAAVQPILSLEQ
ncbi:MAG: Spy/CpxP family protein refolding chaperone, partial [Mariprofundaceae bacterium]